MAKFVQQGGKICDSQTTVVIHFLDNSSKTVLADNGTTVGDVLEEVFGRLMISDPNIVVDNFALYESSDGNLVGDRVANNERVLNVQLSCAKIIMQFRLLLHSVPVSQCSMVRHLLYVQSLHYIITGYYYCSAEDATRLAALCLLERYGVPDKSDDSVAQQISNISKHLFELVPGSIIKQQTPAEWTSQIFNIYNNLQKDPDDPHAMDDTKGLYLSMVENLGSTREQFLCTLFRCKQNFNQKMNQDCVVAINADDIRILDGATFEKLEEYELNTIFQWGFDEATLNFYIRMTEQSQHLTFETAKGVEMSTLLTDIAVARLRDHKNSSSESNDDKSVDDYNYYDSEEEDEDLGGIFKVQEMWTSPLHRVEMEKEYATILLQSVFRSYRARVKFDHYIDMIADGKEDQVREILENERLNNYSQ
jgi:hypothetical protein